MFVTKIGMVSESRIFFTPRPRALIELIRMMATSWLYACATSEGCSMKSRQLRNGRECNRRKNMPSNVEYQVVKTAY
jgi:hypothetical protein